jgi:hypothetical protein
MKIELKFDRMKKLPDGARPALESELFKRLSKQFEDCQLTIKRASNDGLTVFGGDKKVVEHIVQETWESADDGYQWFVEQGGLTRENGQKFREAILSRGNSTDLAELYRNWRGHDPKIEPMLENRGLSE